ncbi:MAG: ribonuclease H-like domain-containing protein [Anaerolineae bacterium]
MTGKPGPLIVLDVETQRLAHEVGGWGNRHQLGVSVAVTYNEATGLYRAYLEGELDALFQELEGAGTVVGYNLIRFDYPVLQPYAPAGFRLQHLPTVDLLDHLERQVGFRVGLDAVATATLGRGKSADGTDAVRWFRQGLLDKVIAYCRQDVEVTYEVYRFGKERGFVLFWDRYRRLREVPVRW